MKPSEALELNRDAIREAVGRYPTANPRIFGSVAHGSDTDESDLDILVDALPGATLFDLGGLHEELVELLGVPVDLRTPQDLSPKFRERVISEAVPV
jgi:predicted nucleotidyltransferase